MKIKYRPHAVDRMLQRKITTEEIELILTEPDGILKQSRDKYLYFKKLLGRKDNLLAAVTLVKSKREFEIIIVMVNFEVEK